MEENEDAQKLVLFAKLFKNCQQHLLSIGRAERGVCVCVNFDFDAFGDLLSLVTFTSFQYNKNGIRKMLNIVHSTKIVFSLINSVS